MLDSRLLREAEAIVDGFDDAQTEFQFRHFVIGREGITPYGEWKQLRREVAARLDIVRAGSAEPRTIEELRSLVRIAADLIPGDDDECRFWTEKLYRRAAIEQVVNGVVSADTLEAILCLPRASWVPIVRALTDGGTARRYLFGNEDEDANSIDSAAGSGVCGQTEPAQLEYGA